jgi:hypothetical protein
MPKDGEMLHNVKAFLRHASYWTTADIYTHIQEHWVTAVRGRMDRMHAPNREKLGWF